MAPKAQLLAGGQSFQGVPLGKALGQHLAGLAIESQQIWQV